MHLPPQCRSTLAIGCFFALVCVLFANAANLWIGFSQRHADAPYILALQDEDQQRYMARAREVIAGHLLIGNPAIREHRFDISPTGFAEWIPASIMWVSGISFSTQVFVTSLLFPFISLLLTFLWLSALLKHRVFTVAVLLLSGLIMWGNGFAGLLRDASPKFTYPLFALYLCLVFLEKDTSCWRLLRGALLGCMVFTYSYHWMLLVTFEGVLMLDMLIVKKIHLRGVVKRALPVFIPFILCASVQALILHHFASQPGLSEIWRHYGLIESHVPGAPLLQIHLGVWTLVAISMWVTGLYRSREFRLLILLLIACIVAVNSNIITGKEMDFQGHFTRVLIVFPYVVVLVALRFLRRHSTAIAWGVIALIVTAQCVLLPTSIRAARQTLTHFDTSDEHAVLQWLHIHTPRESVVLAPYALANMVPATTHNYVFMNAMAHFFFVSERELLDRYLVLLAFFPEDLQPTSIGAPPVFGNYPGHAVARARTWHQLTTLFRVPFTKTIADFIPDQNLRKELDEKALNQSAAEIHRRLQMFELDYLITHNPIPEGLEKSFAFIEKIGRYNIYNYRSL